jgi:hypothetical protein
MTAKQNSYYFYIGNINIAPFIEEFKWEYNDVDAPKSGRTLDAVMHRGRVTDKRKISIKLVPVTLAQCTSIISALRTQYIGINTNMLPEGAVSFTAYNSSRNGGVGFIDTSGAVMNRDVSFNIIER